MSTKNFNKQTIHVVKNTSQNFDAFDVSAQPWVFLYAKWTGAGTGTLKLQVSADGTNWKDLASSSQAVAAAGDYYWDVITASPKVRVVASETGNVADVDVDVWGYAKE